MSRRLLSHSLAGLGLSFGLAAGLAGCSAPDVAQPCPIPPGATDAERTAALNACFKVMSADVVDTKLKKDVDILFMIDNSSSMSPKQKALASAIPQFIKTIDATGASYHVGVVTSDIGTVPPGSTGFTGSVDTRCNTVSGDDGLLQNKPCSARIAAGDSTTEFALACKNGTSPLCPDATFVPKELWIAKDGTTINVQPSNSAGLTTSDIAQKAFQCIGLVGDYGCGVESPLESVKRALDGHRPENKGFLRENSVLAVIFITDEDDCSVQLAQRTALNPKSMNCGTSNPDPDPACFNLDYRCVAKSIQCNESMTTTGQKTKCQERPNNFLESEDKYVKFLSALRTKEKLIVAGIWTPSLLDYQNRGGTGDGKLVVDTTVAGDMSTNLLNRGKKITGTGMAATSQAACFNPDTTLTVTPAAQAEGFFGQAQIRLSTFIRKFDPSVYVEKNICDVAGYNSALDLISQKVVKALTGDCLAVLPSTTATGEPACLVGFVDANQPDALPDVYLPQCTANCCNAWATEAQPIVSNPKIITACMPEAKDCYCAVPSKVPAPDTKCPGTAVAGIWRAGNQPAPSGKVANFRCAGTRPPVVAGYEGGQSTVDVQ